MFEREFILGYEHTQHNGWLDGWTFGTRYINRKLQSTIEDTAIGDAILRYCTRKGIAISATPTTSQCNSDPNVYNYVLINPGKAATVFQDISGRGVADAGFAPQTINLTTDDLALPSATRTYEAVEFTFNRPFDGTWGVAGSYVWGTSIGNYEGAVDSTIGQTDASITQDFDHASNERGATGALPNMHRHTFKVYGTYSPLPGLMIGGNFLAQSGRPYGCVGYEPTSMDPYAPNSGTPSTWYCPNGTVKGTAGSLASQLAAVGATNASYNSVLVGRGKAGFTPWVYQMDTNLSYTWDSEDYGSYTASMDVFNLFDGSSVTRVVEQGEVRTSAGAIKGVKAPFYGLARTYQAPRSVRFGLKFNF
jgi:hypothetical protein